MTLARFLIFSGKTGNIRPFIVYLCTAFLTFLLALSILEIAILVMGALGMAPPLWAIDFFLKLKGLVLKLIHDSK
jgi:hypothetical protein